MQGLLDSLADEDESENDHEDGGDPSNDIERDSVGVLPHEVFAVDKQENEDDHDGKPNTVANLGEDKDFPERNIGYENDTAADYDQDGVEPVEGGSFTEFVVNAGFEAKPFTNNVRSGKRKDAGCEERSIQQTESKGESGPFPCQWNQRFGGFTCIGDVGKAVGMERGGGADDDE